MFRKDLRISGCWGAQQEKGGPSVEEGRSLALKHEPPLGPNIRGSIIVYFSLLSVSLAEAPPIFIQQLASFICGMMLLLHATKPYIYVTRT